LLIHGPRKPPTLNRLICDQVNAPAEQILEGVQKPKVSVGPIARRERPELDQKIQVALVRPEFPGRGRTKQFEPFDKQPPTEPLQFRSVLFDQVQHGHLVANYIDGRSRATEWLANAGNPHPMRRLLGPQPGIKLKRIGSVFWARNVSYLFLLH
jgi:hypothetical protein